MLTLVVYVTVAWTFRDLFPFTVAAMYAQRYDSASSRIVVVEGEGATVGEVQDWSNFVCPADWMDADRTCRSGVHWLDYLDDAAKLWVTQHSIAQATVNHVPVKIVRRIYKLAPDRSEWHTTDCLLAACEARRPL